MGAQDTASDERGGSPARGAASVFRERLWDYVRCPACAQIVREPFSRTSGPVVYIHRSRYCGQSLIVTPARQGSQHRVEMIPSGMTLEQALERALRNVA